MSGPLTETNEPSTYPLHVEPKVLGSPDQFLRAREPSEFAVGNCVDEIYESFFGFSDHINCCDLVREENGWDKQGWGTL